MIEFSSGEPHPEIQPDYEAYFAAERARKAQLVELLVLVRTADEIEGVLNVVDLAKEAQHAALDLIRAEHALDAAVNDLLAQIGDSREMDLRVAALVQLARNEMNALDALCPPEEDEG